MKDITRSPQDSDTIVQVIAILAGFGFAILVGFVFFLAVKGVAYLVEVL